MKSPIDRINLISNQSGKSPWIFVVLLVLAAGGTAFYKWNKDHATESDAIQADLSETAPSSLETESSNPKNAESVEGKSHSNKVKAMANTEEKGCYQVSYKHKELPSHRDGEACTHHVNLIDLGHKSVNKKSLCVRVNGTPVKFQFLKGKSDQLVVGPVAGPNAIVTARFCDKSLACNEDCKVPRDEFLAAIGGGADEDNQVIGQWDPNQKISKDEKALAKEIKEFGQTLEEEEQKRLSLFSGWVAGSKSPACGIKTASSK